jgi:hypothetical protein
VKEEVEVKVEAKVEEEVEVEEEVKVKVEKGGGAQGRTQSADGEMQNGGQVEVRSWMPEARTLSHLCNLWMKFLVRLPLRLLT